jgi:hypothetical protein
MPVITTISPTKYRNLIRTVRVSFRPAAFDSLPLRATPRRPMNDKNLLLGGGSKIAFMTALRRFYPISCTC